MRLNEDAETEPRNPFQSSHPWRGATQAPRLCPSSSGISILAPLAGCDPVCLHVLVHELISILAPLAGCDRRWSHGRRTEAISILAPLAGCDAFTAVIALIICIFQSSHPWRGATQVVTLPFVPVLYFNPRTPGGVRRSWTWQSWYRTHFNPRTPGGVRRDHRLYYGNTGGFQSSHPWRGATEHYGVDAAAIKISILAPLAGCDIPKHTSGG